MILDKPEIAHHLANREKEEGDPVKQHTKSGRNKSIHWFMISAMTSPRHVCNSFSIDTVLEETRPLRASHLHISIGSRQPWCQRRWAPSQLGRASVSMSVGYCLAGLSLSPCSAHDTYAPHGWSFVFPMAPWGLPHVHYDLNLGSTSDLTPAVFSWASIEWVTPSQGLASSVYPFLI